MYSSSLSSFARGVAAHGGRGPGRPERHAIIERARRADKAWAPVPHGSNGYLMLVRLLQGPGFAIMLCYVGFLLL